MSVWGLTNPNSIMSSRSNVASSVTSRLAASRNKNQLFVSRHGGSGTRAWGKIYNGHNNKHIISYGQFSVSHSVVLVILTKFIWPKFLCFGIHDNLWQGNCRGVKWDKLQARPLLEAAKVAEAGPIRGQAASASRLWNLAKSLQTNWNPESRSLIIPRNNRITFSCTLWNWIPTSQVCVSQPLGCNKISYDWEN